MPSKHGVLSSRFVEVDNYNVHLKKIRGELYHEMIRKETTLGHLPAVSPGVRFKEAFVHNLVGGFQQLHDDVLPR